MTRRAPDIAFAARVSAREIRIGKAANPRVHFSGSPERDPTWETERHNLPSEVKDGETYREVAIATLIANRLVVPDED